MLADSYSIFGKTFVWPKTFSSERAEHKVLSGAQEARRRPCDAGYDRVAARWLASV